ncbi:MAG: hypothetical protein COA79_10720 [Planctomycetota bacterium]|nr:MAG: hypothetical protein COA79_10720 [Planctomycetota bacterium]
MGINNQNHLVFFVKHRLTHERVGQMLSGISLLITTIAGLFLSPLFFIGTAMICLNLILAGITGKCVFKNMMIKMGIPGEQDLGRFYPTSKFNQEVNA